MTLTPLQLAAIVSAGVPGIYPVGASAVLDDTADFDSAIIVDSTNRRWRVRAPRRPDASMRLEAEHLILQSFTPGLRARLPFQVPTVVGTVPYQDGSVFIYTHIPGTSYEVDDLAAQNGHMADGQENLAVSLGKILATLHTMPHDLVFEAGLPSYNSEEIRRRRSVELERVAQTGKIPADLLAQWRSVLSPGSTWQFQTHVIHGDMNSDNLVLDGAKIVEVTGWSDVQVGDPAQDFAWLFSCSDQGFTDSVLDAYQRQMRPEPDEHLIQRAHFYAEFAIAQWLAHGAEIGDDDIVQHAVAMLLDVQDGLRATGGLLGQEEEEDIPQVIDDED